VYLVALLDYILLMVRAIVRFFSWLCWFVGAHGLAISLMIWTLPSRNLKRTVINVDVPGMCADDIDLEIDDDPTLPGAHAYPRIVWIDSSLQAELDDIVPNDIAICYSHYDVN